MTQWEDPSCKQAVEQAAWRRPFHANQCELQLQKELHDHVVSKLDLDVASAAGTKEARQQRKRGIRQMISWMKRQDEVRVLRSWAANRKDHQASSQTFQVWFGLGFRVRVRARIL